jgi:hypothetical protein
MTMPLRSRGVFVVAVVVEGWSRVMLLLMLTPPFSCCLVVGCGSKTIPMEPTCPAVRVWTGNRRLRILTMEAVCHSPLVAEAETAFLEATRLSSADEGCPGERP